jgi:hypothetical protein
MPEAGNHTAAWIETAVNAGNLGTDMSAEDQQKTGTSGVPPVTVRNRSVTLGNNRGELVPEPVSKRGNDWVVALFVVALGVLLTPAVQLWAAPGVHWLLPYAVWAVLILLAYALHRRGSDGD